MATKAREIRIHGSMLAAVEKRALIWIAERLPRWVNSDRLTVLGAAALLFAGICYAVGHQLPAALVMVVVLLAVNWFGDSLDGTLARVRGHQRPRYGFYVDHILDTFGALFVLGGLAISGAMTPIVAAAFLVAYYVLSIEIYLATYCVGRFQMSFWGWGPTELRMLLAMGALTLFVKPVVTIVGIEMPLFDVGGIVGTVGILVTAVVSTIGNTRRLYAAEPLPQTKPSQEITRSREKKSPTLLISCSRSVNS